MGDSGEFAGDASIGRVVDGVVKFVRVVVQVEEFRAAPTQVIEFIAVGSHHENGGLAHVPIVSRENAMAKIVFRINAFPRLVRTVAQQGGKAAPVDVFREGQGT